MSALDLSLLTATVDHVGNFLLDRLTETDSAEDPLAERLLILHHLRTERQKLAQLEAIVEAQCAQADGWDKGRYEAAELFAVRRGGAYGRKNWDHETLRSRIAARKACDPETGEVDPTFYGDIVQILSMFEELAHVAYYKVSALRDLGVEFDDACEREPGRRTVQVTIGQPAEEVAS